MTEPNIQADPKVLAGLDHYKNLTAAQQPTWTDQEKLEAARKELAVLPPLVFAGEVDTLRTRQNLI